MVVLIPEGMQAQVGSGLVFRLEHQHKVAEIVVHAVGIQILRTVHAAFQHHASLLVSEGVLHLVVLVGGLHHVNRNGDIVTDRGTRGIVELVRLPPPNLYSAGTPSCRSGKPSVRLPRSNLDNDKNSLPL